MGFAAPLVKMIGSGIGAAAGAAGSGIGAAGRGVGAAGQAIGGGAGSAFHGLRGILRGPQGSPTGGGFEQMPRDLTQHSVSGGSNPFSQPFVPQQVPEQDRMDKIRQFLATNQDGQERRRGGPGSLEQLRQFEEGGSPMARLLQNPRFEQILRGQSQRTGY